MSLYVDAKTAAPDSTRNLQIETLLQEAAQCSGVLWNKVKQKKKTYTASQQGGQGLMLETWVKTPPNAMCFATSRLVLTSRHYRPR